MATLLQSTTIGGHSAIHAGNIGSQSVNYANSAGSTAWTNVSGRPTALSQFTNDLGNYGNWITSAALANYLTTSQVTSSMISGLNNMLGVTSLPYSVDITVDGDPDRFYAVQFWGGDQDVWRRIIIKRGYSEPAPWDPIGTGVHHGGLLLDWEGNFGGWGGAEYADRLRVFNESYTNVCADMFIYSHSMGYVFMLRGGGAVYHLHSDQAINGFYQSGSPDILYSTSTLSYDDAWSGTNQYDVPAPAPLTLAQVNSSRIDGLRTKKQSLLDGRYLRQGVDISGISNITTSNNISSLNFLASNAYYLNGTSYYLNSSNGGIYTNARFESGTLIVAPGGNSTNWNTAHGWGNHASAGYLTSYTETDTLNSVVGRGNTTGGNIITSANMYAEKFIDYSDNTYYVDPGGNGTRAAFLNGNVWISPKPESYGEGIAFLMPSQATWGGLRWLRSVGDYTGAWAFGYFGNESNDNIGFHSAGVNGWRLDHSWNMTVIGSVRTPELRFTNSTNNGYLSGNSEWGMRLTTDNGYIQFGPANNSYAHIYTDRAQFYFNRDILINNVQVVVNSGTWGINVTGSSNTATYALNSTRLYASDAPYRYGDGSPYYMYMNYDGGSYWELKVSPATPGAVRVAYSNIAGSANAVAWTNVSGRPTALSQFTNDLTFTATDDTKLPLEGGVMSGRLTLKSISGVEQTVPNDFGAYLHLGDWGVGRTATGAVLVNTAYRADYATDLFDMNISRFTNNSGYITGYTETDTLQSVTNRGASTSAQVSFTKTDDHAISVGTIRGRAVNSQGGEFIQLYERVNIGGPNGWGADNTAAPSYGLSVFGGANIGYGNSASLFAYAYRGNSNVSGTGEASYHPAGIYSTGTNWLYGTMYVNGNHINDVGYLGVGQSVNTNYRIITSGDYYANAGGNFWAEGRFKQYRGSGTWHDVIDSGNIGSQSVASATRTSGNSGYGHAGTGMWSFFNWGGSNGGTSAPNDSSYTTGISVGSHPSDQAYGFQIANNMWNTGLWTRNYNSGFGSWIRLIDSDIIGSQSVAYASSAGSAPNASNLNASYGVTAGAGNGLKFWGGEDTYKISMGNSDEYHYGPVTDYSIKTVIDSVGATRGFTWGVNGGTPIAALNVGNGNMQIAGTFNSSNFSGSSSGTNTGDQTNISGNSATTSQRVFSDLKINFPSGGGNGHSFGNNHYSMGLDSGNGGWDGPHYRDLIIGYHTGIRLGAHYSGVRFYSDSPTTDTNNDGNGDGGENLLMTVGGYVGTANHTDVVVNNNLIANISLRAPIFYDSNDTSYYLNPAGGSRLRNLYVGDSGDDWSDPGGWGTQVRFSNGPHVKFVLHARTPGIEAGMYVHTPGSVFMGSYTAHILSLMYAGNMRMQVEDSRIYSNVYMEAAGSMRAPIFYDSADTGYYLDPNDTSNLWRFTEGTLNRHSLNSKQVNSPWSTRASQGVLYQTGAMGWGQVDLNVIGSNWGSGFFDTWSSPGNAPGGSSHYVGLQAFHYSNSDSSRFHGWQMVCAQEATNRWFLRSAWDSPRAWVEMIHSGNIGSQTVSNSGTVGGRSVGNGKGNVAYFDAQGNLFINNPETYVGEVRLGAAWARGGVYTSGTLSLSTSASQIDFVFSDSTRAHFASDGNLWMSWAGAYISTLLDAKQNASTAINTSNIGSQSVNYAATAGSASANGGTATALNSSNYISQRGSNGSWNADFQAAPAGTMNYGGDLGANGTNGPGGSWWIQQNFRHTNSSNYWGTQVAWGWEDNANRLATRNVTGGNYGSWVYYLNSSNVTSYMDAPNKAGTSYYQVNTWLQFNGTHGLYWPAYYGGHFSANDLSTYTQFAFRGSKNSYGGFYDDYSRVNGAMYDSGGNGGVYREANGLWYWYYHVGNNSMGIGSSANSSSYVVYASGSIYATGDIVAYSDRRKKTDIVTIDSALDKVMAMRGVFYTKIDESDKGRQVGVIAQEVNEILPEAVTYAADVDEYGVKYGNIVGVLIEAIKEQQKEIDELKAKLN